MSVDEANTSADESPDWRPASAELAFVTAHVGCSEARAKELLLDGLAKGRIGWDCDPDLTVRGDFQAYPSLRTTFAAARGHPFFWRGASLGERNSALGRSDGSVNARAKTSPGSRQ